MLSDMLLDHIQKHVLTSQLFHTSIKHLPSYHQYITKHLIYQAICTTLLSTYYSSYKPFTPQNHYKKYRVLPQTTFQQPISFT